MRGLFLWLAGRKGLSGDTPSALRTDAQLLWRGRTPCGMAFRCCGDSYPQNHPRERRRWGLEWSVREPTPEKGKGVLSMAVCVGKACGQSSGKHGRLWKWRDGSRVGGFGEGDLFSEKAPFPYASYAFKASLLWNVPLRYPSRSASSKEARFRLMAETRSGMSCTISSILPEQATSSRQRAGSSSTRRS